MRALRPLVTAALLLASCDSLPPAPTAGEGPAPCGSSSRPWGTPGCPQSAVPRFPSLPARSVPSLPLPAAAPAQPRPGAVATVVEVEVSGRLVVPREAPSGRLLVALTDGPCFQPGTHYLAWAQPGASGTYLLDIFPPVGTALEACGAIVESQRGRVAWWGRADRGTMAVQGRGKTVYRDTEIPLRRGPEVPLPVGLGLTF